MKLRDIVFFEMSKEVGYVCVLVMQEGNLMGRFANGKKVHYLHAAELRARGGKVIGNLDDCPTDPNEAISWVNKKIAAHTKDPDVRFGGII